MVLPFNNSRQWIKNSVAEFKEFERRFKFNPGFKYGWFVVNSVIILVSSYALVLIIS